MLQSSPVQDPLPLPVRERRGMRRWAYGLLILVLAAVNLRAGITVVGPLAGVVGEDLGTGGVGVAFLVSLPLICFGLFSPLVPRVCAGRSIEAVMVAALCSICLGSAARSVDVAGALWVGTVALGAGIAVLNVVMPAMLKRDFPDHIAVITGVYMSVQAVAAAISTSTAVPIADTTSWRLAFGLWAVPPVIGIGVLVPRVMRRSAETSLSVGVAGPGYQAPSAWSPWRSARGWQMAVFMGAQSTVYYVILTSWPTLEVAAGVDPAVAGVHQGVMQIASIAGLLLWSWVLRWMPRDQRVLAWTAVITIGAVVMAAACPGHILVWNVLIGVTTGGALVHSLALFGLHTRNATQAISASAMGQSFGYFVAACGPVVAGVLLGATAQGRGVFVLLVVLLVLQMAAAHLAGAPRREADFVG